MPTETGVMHNLTHSKWWIPALSVFMGLVMLVAATIGGQIQTGLWMLGLMVVFGAGVLVAGRSETVRGLRGDGRDERFAMLDLKATAATGVMILAIIAGFLFEIAHGRSGEPYTWLGAVAGVSYLVFVVILRLRD